uniref:Uncharacterized protein n=1 Tax=Hyaloperonospora arabidopsidis (strain Emoy2) TaxID=559515 RepID=M4C011_HYAAE
MWQTNFNGGGNSRRRRRVDGTARSTADDRRRDVMLDLEHDAERKSGVIRTIDWSLKAKCLFFFQETKWSDCLWD